MKKFMLKCCCIIVSVFFCTSTAMAKTVQKNVPYDVSTTSSDVQLIIKDTYNILTQEQKEFIQQVFYTSFAEIWDKYGYTEKAPVITFIIDDKLVPADAGAAELGNGLIAFKQNSFSYISGHTTDHIVHELTHVAQEYKNKTTFQWLAEGIADYITSEYSEHKLSLIPTQYAGGELYDGYLVTAGFLKWLEQKYPNTVMQLHITFQQGNIKYETFQALTGKTLSDLWKEYSGKELPSLEQYLFSQNKISDFIKIADYYYYGYFGEVNYTEALKYYQKAADKGDMNALRRVADMYCSDEFGKADYQKAFELYTKVANSETLNSIYACNMLGNIIFAGYIETMQPQQASSYYKRAIALEEKRGIITEKSIHAMTKLGDLYSNINDIQAVSWYEKAMQQGSFYAQNRLGYFYLEGIFVEKDIQKAQQYFINVFENPASSDNDKYSATTNLGNLYAKENDPQAIIWYKKATEYGNISCFNKLGDIYLKGAITAKDTQKAYFYFNNVVTNEKASEEQKEYANKKLKTIQ